VRKRVVPGVTAARCRTDARELAAVGHELSLRFRPTTCPTGSPGRDKVVRDGG
jgi:hypothetical protein